MACKYGFEEIAILLVSKSADIELLMSPSSQEELAIHVACRNKTEKFAIVHKMLEKLRDYSLRKKNNCLHTALEKCDNSGQNILQISIDNNHLEIVEFLLSEFWRDREQTPDNAGNYPIHIAAKNGSTEMFNILKKHDAVTFNLNDNNENPLHIAAFNNKQKFIREFLNFERYLMEGGSGSDSESKGKIPCVCGCDAMANHKRLIFQRDSNNYTPLHSAIVSSSHKCVSELMREEGLELDSKDKDGNSIYHLCTEFNNTDSFKFLLQKEGPGSELIYTKNNLDEYVCYQYFIMFIFITIQNKLRQ